MSYSWLVGYGEQYILAESTQIHRFATHIGAMNIQIARLLRMTGENHAVQHARFPGTVRTIDQGQGTDGNSLRFGKGLEIADS